MNKEAVRRLTVPYGVVVVPEHAAFAFFNREYEPLGVPQYVRILIRRRFE